MSVTRRRDKAVRLCRRANQLMDQERKQAATSLLRRAIELDDSYYHAYFLMALLLRDDNRPEEIACLRKSVALEPRYQQSWYYLGVALSRTRDTLREGIMALEEAHRLDPSDVWSVVMLGNRLSFAGDEDQAGEFYRKAMEMEPDNEQFRVWHEEYLRFSREAVANNSYKPSTN